MTRKYVKSGRPRKERISREVLVKRRGMTCLMCEKYPCFRGIDNMSSNFAEEGCTGFKLKNIEV